MGKLSTGTIRKNTLKCSVEGIREVVSRKRKARGIRHNNGTHENKIFLNNLTEPLIRELRKKNKKK